MFNFFALSNTKALGLSVKTSPTFTLPLPAKYLYIFSTFDPLPEANKANVFMMVLKFSFN